MKENSIQKIAMFVFNGDPMCFIHVLLNALSMFESDYETKIVVEGSATGLIGAMAEEGHPLHVLWEKVKNLGLVEGVCKACASKMGTSEAALAQGLALLDDMNGHPGIATYMDKGYEIITF